MSAQSRPVPPSSPAAQPAAAAMSRLSCAGACMALEWRDLAIPTYALDFSAPVPPALAPAYHRSDSSCRPSACSASAMARRAAQLPPAPPCTRAARPAGPGPPSPAARACASLYAATASACLPSPESEAARPSQDAALPPAPSTPPADAPALKHAAASPYRDLSNMPRPHLAHASSNSSGPIMPASRAPWMQAIASSVPDSPASPSAHLMHPSAHLWRRAASSAYARPYSAAASAYLPIPSSASAAAMQSSGLFSPPLVPPQHSSAFWRILARPAPPSPAPALSAMSMHARACSRAREGSRAAAPASASAASPSLPIPPSARPHLAHPSAAFSCSPPRALRYHPAASA